MTQPLVYEVLASAFHDEGVTDHFCLTGDANMYFVHALVHKHDVKTFHARHEHCAVSMADGYFRAASSNDGTRGADVIIAGQRCPIAGRISMDLMAVDITDLPPKAARRGHMATLIGEGITVDELAHHFGTIGYEVLTSLGSRYARIYKGGATTPP